MSETTTTSSGSEMSAEASIIAASQAVNQDSATSGAEESSAKTHTDTQSGSESVDTSTTDKTTTATDDADLAWLKNKGVDIDDPKAVAAAWRKAEQEFHKTRQESKASQSIQQQVAEDDTVQQLDQAVGLDPEVVQLKRDVAEMRFFNAHPEITAENREQATSDIVEMAKKYPLLASAFDLETLWAIAKSQKVATVEQTAEARGRKAAKEDLSKSSGAVIPAGDASGGKKADNQSDFLKGFTG